MRHRCEKKHGFERIQGHTDSLARLTREYFEMMEDRYPDFEVITTQVVQLNTCVTMFVTYVH